MYTIIQSKEFKNQINALYSSHQRFNEMNNAIAWALERNPRALGFLIEDNYFIWVTEQLPIKDIPKVRILYRINDRKMTVSLLSISEFVDQP